MIDQSFGQPDRVGSDDPAGELWKPAIQSCPRNHAIAWSCDLQVDSDAASDPRQNPAADLAGSWRETEFAGTGFPKVFDLRYHLQRPTFPLMALGHWLLRGNDVETAALVRSAKVESPLNV